MKIKKGDTIGIIALSGDCDKDKIELAKSNIESLDYRVKLSGNIFDKNRYLAGSDSSKLNELHNFFQDSEIKLILCARGGYGAIRLVNVIDYDLIKNNPKPFCGYSDVTALLAMIYKKTGVITYHSPMAQGDFTKFDTQSINKFIDSINNSHFKYTADKVWHNGTANGILWGGNLATLVSLCGLDFIPDKDFIFFTEDINEPVYKIDKMFQQLINIEKFSNNCKGIILGEFLGVDNEVWLNEYFEELASNLFLPIIQINSITHGENKITLPIGVKAKISGDRFTID